MRDGKLGWARSTFNITTAAYTRWTPTFYLAASFQRDDQSFGRSDELPRKMVGWISVCGRRPDDVQAVSSYHTHLPSVQSSWYSSGSSRRRMKSGDDVDGGFDVGRSARPKRCSEVMRPAGNILQLCSMTMWELKYVKLTWSAC